jgi:type I restriction enzyme M protein
MVRTKKDAAPKTTAQRLDSIVKSARKIMRKDKGLNGELDRLPMLTWILFMKFLDDLERIHEDEALMAGQDFYPAIEAPYRWRDWAAQADGITGPDLINFIAAEEATFPDGQRRPGLFVTLRALRGRNGGRDRRDVIATVFRGLSNRMESGYLLRDVVNLVNDIHFDSSDEIHTLSRLYESLLREMRDAAGDSGEFYTPRSVVRFMVEVINPRIGETVLDPACGTGGFLAEAFTHLTRQANTVEQSAQIQQSAILGCEAKSLPFLLTQMNLLLHGLEAPNIDPGNSLRFRLSEIGERERVEVILTNPPFGGEEETGILTNFPEDRRTSQTELLFLQLIMRRLKRAGLGRAGVVVPHGTLFGDGVAARIKADLLEQFNLHTVIRLPEGVFAPYTDIASNLIFFDTSGPTREVWYWEQPAPTGRRKYSKTAPMQYDELTDCLAWWKDRQEGPQAWKVKAADIICRDEKGNVIAVNLDLKNPSAKEKIDHRPPEEIIQSVTIKEREVLAILAEITELLAEKVPS